MRRNNSRWILFVFLFTILALVTMLLCGACGLWWPLGSGEERKQVRFEKVQEETYENFIKDIAFGSVVKDGKTQMYCKMIWLDGKGVQFLNETGEIISTKSLAVVGPQEEGRFIGWRVAFSCDGNFAAIDEYVEIVVYPGAEMFPTVEEHYTIFDEKGQELYTVEGILEGKNWDDRFLISDKDGSAVGTRFSYGALDFYSPEGQVKTVPLFGELGWGRGGPGYAAFSRDGEYLAVLIQYIGKRPQRRSYEADEVWCMLFDKSGNELWRRKVDERQRGNIAISEHGEYMFFKAFTRERTPRKRGEPPPEKGERDNLTSVTLSLYDKAGNDLSFKDTSLFAFGGFCFSPKADYVALAGANLIRLTGANLIRLISTKDGSTVFDLELPENYRIRDQLFSADGKHLIVKAGYLWVFNMKGDQLLRHAFPTRLRGIFSENGFLAFSFSHKYEIYKIIEKD